MTWLESGRRCPVLYWLHGLGGTYRSTAQRYDTPPPRSESMLIEELIPYVEAHLPAIAGRNGRALGGLSYGSIGTGVIGLHHPDMFAALQMTSGGGFPWPQLGSVTAPAGVRVASPAPAPAHVPSPGIQPYLDSTGAVPMIFIGSYGDGFTGDSVWTRYNSPPDLVGNARATAAGEQVVKLRITVNDGVPRRLEDVTDPFTPIAAGLELALATTPSRFMHDEAQRLGVAHELLIAPGVHSHPYWRPFLREAIESMYARLQHWDGHGHVDPAPDRFDYRSIAKDFSIWGWDVSAQRASDEFLDLTDVTCSGLTL